METTFKKLDGTIEHFPWGNIIKIHTVGEYQIIEYTEKEGFRPEFHIYVKSEDTNRGAATLDEALAIAIAYKHEGRNLRAAQYFMKMIS